MSTKTKLRFASGNPALAKASSDEIERLALDGCIALFDMQTIVSTTMTDLSPRGANDATFNTTPTTDANGVVFAGSDYAEFTLSAALGSEYSVLCVFKGTGSGTKAVSSYNHTNVRGNSIYIANNRMRVQGSSASNISLGPTVSGSTWIAGIMKVKDRVPRLYKLGSGYHNYYNALFSDKLDAETVWRIGAGYGTAGAAYQPVSGTIAAVALWDRVTTLRQDLAIKSYIETEFLTPRSITLS